MAWPPPALPTNRTDALAQQANHPADHNAVNLAVNDTVAHVQGIDTRLAVRGPICSTAGQIITAGNVVVVNWENISDPSFGPSPFLTVPAGADGVYGLTVRVDGPAVPAGLFGAVWIVVGSGVHHGNYYPQNRTEVTLGMTLPLAAGTSLWVELYNPTAGDASFAVTFNVLRVAA